MCPFIWGQLHREQPELTARWLTTMEPEEALAQWRGLDEGKQVPTFLAMTPQAAADFLEVPPCQSSTGCLASCCCSPMTRTHHACVALLMPVFACFTLIDVCRCGGFSRTKILMPARHNITGHCAWTEPPMHTTRCMAPRPRHAESVLTHQPPAACQCGGAGAAAFQAVARNPGQDPDPDGPPPGPEHPAGELQDKTRKIHLSLPTRLIRRLSST